ncbi:MAG: hypothetical protein QOI96_1838, partial [Verrucomicrobiota bacterium]
MIVSEVRELLSRAQDEGVGLSELQLDFDCPATQIAVYSRWLARLRSLIRPLRL